MINCYIELDLVKYCVISEISRTGVTFKINSIKLYVSVVTLYINDNIKHKEKIQ